MNNMTKKEFINQLKNSYKKIEHLSDRRLDYKYLEYKLYNVLIKYVDEYDFSVLGLPENININIFEDYRSYDINRMTHVTLNAELFRLYDCGCYCEEDFIDYVNNTINRYKAGEIKIKDLVYEIRKERLDYVNNILTFDKS